MSRQVRYIQSSHVKILACSLLFLVFAFSATGNVIARGNGASGSYDIDLLHMYLENQQYHEAIELILPSAEAGNPEDQHMVGELYKASSSSDYKEALSWFVKAINQDYAPAKVSLANMYLAGQGVEKDYQEAVKLLTEAESQGDETAKLLLEKGRRNGWWGLTDK